MENYGVSKISPGNCLRMKHQTLERTGKHVGHNRSSSANSFLLHPKSYTHPSTLFSTAFTSTLQIPSFGFSALDGYGRTGTLPTPFSTPRLWSLMVSRAGLLPRSNVERPRPQLFATVCTTDTLRNPSPHSSSKTPAQKVLQPQTPCTTHAFNCSPEVHSYQVAACSSGISGPMY